MYLNNNRINPHPQTNPSSSNLVYIGGIWFGSVKV